MILTVDIGNTNVVFGVFADGPEPVSVSRLPSSRNWDICGWRYALDRLVLEERLPLEVDGCVLSSVVPEITGQLRPALERLTGRPVLVADHTLDDGLVLVGYDRKGLGNDRVVDAVAALAHYKPPIAIFDLGTATTLSVLDAAGRFIGGMILAGMRLSVEALGAKASQLPAVQIEEPKALLGLDAVSCMQSGVVYGTAAQIDGLSDRVEAQLSRSVTTVVTGGMGRLVLPHCRRPLLYDEHLLLKGLRYIYERERGQRGRCY